MNKYSKLIKNTGIFFVANLGSKVLTFFLVRFYTELLSTEEYGIIDLFNTTASLAFPLVTLCITEAVLRFSIDDNENRGKILTNGLTVALLGNLLFVFTAPILLKVATFSENIAWIFLLTISNSIYTIVAHFSRGIGKTKLFASSGLIHTILQIGLNILFLVGFSWGIKGYLRASVWANVLTMLYVFFKGNLRQYIVREFDKKYLKMMVVYSIPLIPNALFWWMMQSADRYAIAYMLSASDNGLYAVANKIPTLITTISNIFFQAWQLSSVEEANSKEKNQFYTKVFQSLSTLLILATSFLMLSLQPLYKLLTEETYYKGWTCTPFLLCAMVYSCYSSFLGTNYVAMKKTKGVFFTTVIGAILNVVLNILLIPIIGLEGTAVATFAAFFVTWISRIFGTRKFVKIKYSIKKFWIPSGIVIVQAIILTFGVKSLLIQLAFLICLIGIYLKDIIELVKYGYSYIVPKRR